MMEEEHRDDMEKQKMEKNKSFHKKLAESFQ